MRTSTASVCRNGVRLLLAAATIILPARSDGTSWRLPPAGARMYVVASDIYTQRGGVFVVDTRRGEVTGSLTTGYGPDIAVSRDGTPLYLSSERKDRTGGGTLDVIDAATGTVMTETDDPDPWPSNGGAYNSRMTLSRDGKWLFRYTIRQDAGGAVSYIKTFDTARGAFLPQRIALTTCGAAALLAGEERQRLYVVCSDSQDVRVLNLADQGGGLQGEPARLKTLDGRFGEHSTAFMTSPGVLTVIKGDGQFVKDDLRTLRRVERGRIDGAAATSAAETSGNDWLAGRQIWRQPPRLSPDGSRLYLLVATGPDTRAVHDQVLVLETATFRRVQTIALSRPCVSIALSSDGTQLFGVDTLNSSVLVMNAATGQELRTISGVGPRPVFAVVAAN